MIPSTWAGRICALALAWGLVMTTLSLVSAGKPPPANRPIQQVANDYVSSDTCRACHPGNYASWHASFHRTMTQVASPATVATELDGLKLTDDGIDYCIEKKSGAYYVRTKPQGADDSSLGKPMQIVLLTGSHRLQIYWTETGDGRTLGQFPFSYIVAEKKWALVQHTFLSPPGPQQIYSKGDWNAACMTCHVTHGRARFEGNGKYDSMVSEFGIACEACHSGGKEHIAMNRDPLRRFMLHFTGGHDQTIANPARMDGPTSTLVCGQCHSISVFKNAHDRAIWDRQNGVYRPGQKEFDLRWIAQPNGTDHPVERASLKETDPHFFGDQFWGDGQVRVIGREANALMASPCYKGNNYSCTTCHELHPKNPDQATLTEWASKQMKPQMTTNVACLECHKQFKLPATLAAHTHHAADSSGSTCYNCHMPKTIYGLLHASRSHQISIPNARESSELGRPNACNLCHLDQSLAWTAGKLHEWYGQKTPQLTSDERDWSFGAQWLLKGDAGQRALIVYNMGWEPAQKASGRDWLYPYLIFELNDPYAAVRFGAWKSLQTLPGFESYDFDYTVDDAQQKQALALAYQKWFREVKSPRALFAPQTILDSTGMFQQDVFDRMLDQRNRRPVTIAE